MRFIYKIVVVLMVLSFANCMPDSGNQGSIVETEEKVELVSDKVKTVESGVFQISSKASSVIWKGERITGEYHTGTVDIKSGYIDLSESGIQGGEVIFDMTSMKELNPESEEVTIVVMGYLQSERFFNTDKYPNAVLTIKGEKENKLWCDLTVRNIKREILIPYTKSLKNDTLKTSANFKIDRTDWGIDFRSAKNYKDLGMMAIKDSIGFKTAILAVKKVN